METSPGYEYWRRVLETSPRYESRKRVLQTSPGVEAVNARSGLGSRDEMGAQLVRKTRELESHCAMKIMSLLDHSNPPPPLHPQQPHPPLLAPPLDQWRPRADGWGRGQSYWQTTPRQAW